MKRALLSMTGLLALAAAIAPATAADIPQRPRIYTKEPVVAPQLFDWSGFYLGVNAGWAWNRSEFDFGGAGSTNFNSDGWLAGGTIGANYQAGQTVFGVEADFDWADIKGSASCTAGTCETTNKWLGTVRGRLGYAAGRLMPYVTGGLAYGKVEASVPGTGSASETRYGWTVGGGVEYAFDRNWSAKAEYLYVDLGKFDCGAACGVTPNDVGYKAHVVRGGINYRF